MVIIKNKSKGTDRRRLSDEKKGICIYTIKVYKEDKETIKRVCKESKLTVYQFLNNLLEGF